MVEEEKGAGIGIIIAIILIFFMVAAIVVMKGWL